MEIFARRASLCGCLRQKLPNSFAVGSGCSQTAAAPIIPIDVLTDGGQALCATWARESSCAWVHIRCPKSLFPHGKSPLSSGDTERCMSVVQNLVKHCSAANTHWTIEAPARSSFWSTPFGKSHLSQMFSSALLARPRLVPFAWHPRCPLHSTNCRC